MLTSSATARRHQKQKETKKYIEDFMTEQKMWKQLELARQKEENERIQAYSKMLQNRDDEIKHSKQDKELHRNQIYQKVSINFCHVSQTIACRRNGQQGKTQRRN